MGELIVLFVVFWVVGKILKGIFGGFSQSDSGVTVKPEGKCIILSFILIRP